MKGDTVRLLVSHFAAVERLGLRGACRALPSTASRGGLHPLTYLRSSAPLSYLRLHLFLAPASRPSRVRLMSTLKRRGHH